MNGNFKPNWISRISPKFYLVLCSLILLSLACNIPVMANQSPGVQNQPAGFVETSIVETMIALSDGDVQSDPGQDTASDSEQDTAPEPATATETATPENTETPTLTPTVTETPTPEVAMVYVSANTNCREGQGTGFAWLTSLATGDEAEAIGVENTGDYPYWYIRRPYIRRPDQPNSFCWLWGKYATPSGPYESLPVFTPMPTPTQGFDFQITYEKLEGPCSGGSFWTQYKIVNNGAFTLESWRTKADDHTGGSNPQEWIKDKFLEMSGCPVTSQQNDLTPGESHHVIAKFGSDPSGHDITVRIKICQANGLNEPCLTKTYRHTP